MAVNRNFTNQSGEREADFINCVIWRKPAETLANYARKGTLLGVTGRIQTRSYDNQQGQRVYVTEVVADNFQLLESRNASEQRRTTEAVEILRIILVVLLDSETIAQIKINPLTHQECLTLIEIILIHSETRH